jgi:hypothetical protein
MLTINNDKATKELFKNLYQEIANIRTQVLFNRHFFPDGNADDECDSYYYRYILINKNNNKKLCGNLIWLIQKIDDVIDYHFDYDIYSLYGILERFKIINKLDKIDGVIVYDLFETYDNLIKFDMIKSIEMNNKVMTYNDLNLDKINNLYSFLSFVSKYFNQEGVNQFKLYYKLKKEEFTFDLDYNIYKLATKGKNSMRIQTAINKSKKDNYCNLSIMV